ncbi:hypothetical protein LMG28138_04305 [Pararobbsia alpina]|uniref:Uncharacterized protein n=1 Tax=Pararobbsia alpina TaxID=621374 RepID=A0A6S7BEI4_9BURK|nr:hypothetical protein LMG28138_04305 [Pararobbsia alpina]
MIRCPSVCCPRRRRCLGPNYARGATLTDRVVSLDTSEPKVPYWRESGPLQQSPGRRQRVAYGSSPWHRVGFRVVGRNSEINCRQSFVECMRERRQQPKDPLTRPNATVRLIATMF